MNLLKLVEKQCADQPELVGLVTQALRDSVHRDIVQSEAIHYEEKIKEMEVQARASKTELFSPKMDELKKTDRGEFIKCLIFLCSDTIFFADKTILEWLADLGLPNKVTRWFVPIEKINAEFEKINASSQLLVRRLDWIYFIHIHLTMNLIDEIYTWEGKVGRARNSYYNDLHNTLYNLHRTKKYFQNANKSFKGANFGVQMIPLLEQLAEHHNSEKEAQKGLLQSVQGKTEKNTLAFAFNECSFHFVAGQVPYILTWDLFKFLLPNRNLMDKEVFENSEQFETYERNYRRYQYYTLKKIIPITGG